jgi:hypothetical protein
MIFNHIAHIASNGKTKASDALEMMWMKAVVAHFTDHYYSICRERLRKFTTTLYQYSRPPVW